MDITLAKFLFATCIDFAFLLPANGIHLGYFYMRNWQHKSLGMGSYRNWLIKMESDLLLSFYRSFPVIYVNAKMHLIIWLIAFNHSN